MRDWRRDVRVRLEPLGLDPAREAELVDELGAHLDDRFGDLCARGVSRDEALRRTLAELESHDALRLECGRLESEAAAFRQRWRRRLRTVAIDVRQGVRGVLRRPAHAAAVAFTLGVGMAAATTLYAVVDAVIIRPLPYPDADRLIVAGLTTHALGAGAAGGRQVLYGASPADAYDWRARTRAFEALAPVEQRTFFHDWGQGPEVVDAAAVGEGLLDLLGAIPIDGRAFVPADFAAEAPDIAIISHAAWLNRFGGASDVVGRSLEGLIIVGILAPGFTVPEAVFTRTPDVWMPMRPADERYQSRRRRTGLVAGRLRPGVSLDDARREIDAVHATIAAEHPDAHRTPDGGRTGAGINTLHAQTVGDAGRPVFVFFGAATLLLGLATLNAANLVLLRTLNRQGELAVRRALGADGGRILRELVVENVVVSLAACLVGAVVAYAGVALVVRFGPDSVPRLDEAAVNGRVLFVAAAASVGVGMLLGLVPALRAATSEPASPGAGGEIGYTAAPAGNRLRMLLVTVQVAAATVLVVGAGLLVATYVRIGTNDLGFEPDGLASFTLPIKIPKEGASSQHVWDDLLAEVGRVPGLRHVAGTTDLPFTTSAWKPGVGLNGAEPAPILGGFAGFVVTPSYFETIGARIVAGRSLSTTDLAAAEGAVVVNETFVRQLVADRDPIGTPVTVEGGFGALSGRIVGVVADIVEGRVESGIRPAVYLPHTQMPWITGPTVVVRIERDADAVLADLRRRAAAYDASLPVIGLGLVQDRANRAIVDPRFRAALFAAFATASLLLSAIGLYGSLAHTVGRRRRELGIRMALGADGRRVYWMVLRQGALVGLAGLSVGLTGAAVLGRFVERFLFGVAAREPAIFAGTAVVLLAVSLLASVRPARRAARVDVVESLKHA